VEQTPNRSAVLSATACDLTYLPRRRTDGRDSLIQPTHTADGVPLVLCTGDRIPTQRSRSNANNRIECDHGRLKSRLRPMRGLKQDRSARVIIAGHALVQNLRRGHYELAVEEPVGRRVAVAFDELALAV
jgi:DDE domain